MQLVDARRLTGPNLQTRVPGAVTEVAFEPGDDPQACYARWQHHLQSICEHLPFAGGPTVARFYEGGAAWVLPGAIDRLYAVILACEYAVAQTIAEQKGETGPDVAETLEAIRAEYEEEQCETLLSIEQEAQKQKVPFLWDDDFVSVGYGKDSITWPERQLPQPQDIPWNTLSSIPIVFITGTNGKTTTSRLLARMVRCAGLAPRNSSTDGVFVNEQLVEEGDWTGPGAARTILRRKDVDVAVLEAARGGILRRGLGVESCEAALVTNVANDHLGDYGIHTVPQMAQAKGVVYDVVSPDGFCVFNGDDENTRQLGKTKPGKNIFFSVHGKTAFLEERQKMGDALLYVEQGNIIWEHEGQQQILCPIADCPLSMHGTALYNVSNILGAVALGKALKLPSPAMLEALQSFGASWHDNPGRGQLTNLNGVQILLDFGHNPHGVSAVLTMARDLLAKQNQGGRFSVSMGQAGDRNDADLIELCESVAPLKPARIYLRDMKEYLRGREQGEVPQIMKSNLQKMDYPESQIFHCETEIESLHHALEWAKSGDLVVHLVHTEREPIQQFLKESGAQMG